MERVAIIAVAQTPMSPGDPARTAPEMVFEVARRAVAESGLPAGAIDLLVSGSSDMLEGRSFNFAFALEAMGAYPPVQESHVEMDGAWAAYYAWLKILAGEARVALVIAWGKSSEADLDRVLNTQLDPFFLAPLGLTHRASAALQADAWMQRTGTSVEALDEVARRARAAGARNAHVRAMLTPSLDPSLDPSPLRREGGVGAAPITDGACAPITDGACALILSAEDVARSVCPRPAWIVGADHRTETGALGHRDLSRLPGATHAAARACALANWPNLATVEVAELAASFAHQVPMLAEALDLAPTATINPSGGALVADPILVTGLVRLGEAALQIMGRAGAHQVPDVRRALAHAAAGHALQQNLIFLLEGSP
jgi:acetyl-CoA acetyltransferase